MTKNILIILFGLDGAICGILYGLLTIKLIKKNLE